MPARDKRIDAYIAKAAPFARPILTHIRGVVHEACPDVEESLKWGAPAYLHHGILCITAAFKAHCALVLWRAPLIVGAVKSRDARGHFGKLTAVKDLPSRKVLVGLLKQAVKLNGSGAKTSQRAKGKPKKAVATPADLAAGLKKSTKARAAWAAFSPSARREYIDWITEAKRPETRAERLKTTLQWVAQGKQRNWKYA
ncbi:MAG TPA: YdeI/OmpD-associated family protein [Gemmatimonadales bacterium]|nr:YdeI/OmpD-associated family protein [Gemmatimonadales bacterium]